jgi:hypothetical protein
VIPRYPIRYGRISSLRGTGVTAAGAPGAAVYDVLTQSVTVAGATGSAVFTRDPYALARGLEPLAGLPGAVAFTSEAILAPREFVVTGRRGCLGARSYAVPDVSGGVVVMFEEVSGGVSVTFEEVSGGVSVTFEEVYPI